jgi:hypothetical protein
VGDQARQLGGEGRQDRCLRQAEVEGRFLDRRAQADQRAVDDAVERVVKLAREGAGDQEDGEQLREVFDDGDEPGLAGERVGRKAQASQQGVLGGAGQLHREEPDGQREQYHRPRLALEAVVAVDPGGQRRGAHRDGNVDQHLPTPPGRSNHTIRLAPDKRRPRAVAYRTRVRAPRVACRTDLTAHGRS